ncbi:MAG: hypothetical protein ACFFAN_05430 [Promethearchaeota archaeon]
MIKLLCKVMFTPNTSNEPIEVVGEVDKLQLNSQNCEWISVKSYYCLNNKLHSRESLIHKRDIVEILTYKESKRYVVDKESLALNTLVLSFREANSSSRRERSSNYLIQS